MDSFKKTMERCLALVLVAAMLVSIVDIGLVARVNAASSDETVSLGSMIVNTVEGLEEAEKNILTSGLLAGDSVSYQKPKSSYNLISVDAETKTVTVSPYTDSKGNVWTITACRVVYTGGEEEVTLTDGQGTFTYEGDFYTVEADFALSVDADAELTEKLLNAPYWLAKGVDNLNVLNSTDVRTGLRTMHDPQIKSLLYKLGYEIVYIDSPAAKNLYGQLNSNGDKLDLEVLLDTEDSSTTHLLVTKGAEIKDKAIETYSDLKSIYDLMTLFSNGYTLVDGMTEEQYRVAVNSLAALLEDMKPVTEDPWTILENTDVLKSGMTEAEYIRLDSLVAADASLASRPYTGEVPAALKVAEATVEYSMNRFTVTVEVKAEVIEGVGTTETVSMPTKSTSLKVNAGVTGTEILTMIQDTGIEAEALDQWDPLYAINGTNYSRDVSLNLDEDYTLEGNVTYTVTYIPKTMTVTYGEGFAEEEKTPVSVPFGYQLLLPRYAGEQVYDYIVNGINADQGDVIRITGNTTISRSLAKAWENHSLGKLVAENFASTDAAAQSILISPALTTGTFRLRTPTAVDGLLIMDSVSGSYRVTAKAYKANTDDLWWVPAYGTLTGGADDGTSVSFTLTGDHTYTATIDGSLTFDQVVVTYQVATFWEVLGIGEADAARLLNLPHTLTTDAVVQLRTMSKLNGQYSNIDTLNQNLNAIKMAVNGSEMPQEAKDAVTDLVANCTNGETLYVYTSLTDYRTCGTDAERLAWYYRNYDGVTGLKAQIDRVVADFKVLAVDNREAFIDFLTEMKYEDYVDKIDTIYAALLEVQDDLKDPNEAINLNSAALNDLAGLIVNSIGHTQAYSGALSAPVLSTNLSVDAPDKISVTVTVQVKNSDGNVIKEASGSIAFPAEGGSLSLTAGQALQLSQLKAELYDSLLATQADKSHYQTAVSNTIPGEGDCLTGSVQAAAVYAPTTYTVKFVDENGDDLGTVPFPFDRPTVTLPACTDGVNRYDYLIYGQWKSDASYTFTETQIDQFVDGCYTITRKAVDVSREKIDQLVSQLNQAIVDADMIFTLGGRNCLKASVIPVEHNGRLSLVLRICAENTDQVDVALQKVAQALVNSSYSYIGIGDGALKANDQIHLQGLVDAILDSGMGLTTITGMIDANGNLNEMTLPGDPVGADANNVIPVGGCYINDASLYGAKLMETTLFLGTSQEAGTELPLYITMEDFDRSSSALLSVRNAAVNVLRYVDITADSGRFNVQLKLSDRMYQAVVSAMLAADLVKLEELDSIDPVEVVHYLYNIVKVPLEDENVTAATLQNSLNKLGYSVNLSGYNKIAPIVRNLMENATVSDEAGTTDTYLATLSYSLSELIESMNIGALAGMIAESETGLDLPVSLKVDNLNKTYQGVVVDLGAAGAGKLRYYSDAESFRGALSGINTHALVILLSDCDSDLSLGGQNVVLDLNGKTLNGSLIAGSRTLVLDSSKQNSGAVTGNLSGNLTVTAGNYSVDVSDFLPASGYSQVDGKVQNDLYQWVEDADGNYTIALNGDMLKMDKMPSVQALALELVYDMLVKHFTSASMSFDAYGIYSVEVNDLVDLIGGGVDAGTANELLACINTDGITDLTNDLLNVLTDFDAMSTAMTENDGVLKTYTMATGAWTIALDRVADGDYLTASIIPGSETTRRTVTLQILDNANGDFAALVDKVKDVADVEIEVNLDPLTYGNGSLHVNASGSVNAVFNLNTNPDYAAVIAVLLADQTSGALKDNLIAAVMSYANTGKTADMKNAIEAVTVAQLVSALKSMERDTFAQVLESLDLADLSNVQALEAVYDDFLVMVGNVASALNITGGNRTIGSYADSYGTYDLSRVIRPGYDGRLNLTAELDVHVLLNLLDEDPEATIIVTNSDDVKVYAGESLTDAFAAASESATIWIYGSVTLTGDVTVSENIEIIGAGYINQNGKAIALALGASLKTDAALAVTTDEPFYEVVERDGVYVLSVLNPTLTGTVTVTPFENVVVGSKVDTRNGYIFLDVNPYNGITEAQLKDCLSAEAENASTVTCRVIEGVLEGRVINGATLKIEATNTASSEVATMQFTIIIMGDTNCDGVTGAGDAVLMTRYYLYGIELAEPIKLAADMNQNGEIDAGDAVKNATKFTLWDNGTYESALN